MFLFHLLQYTYRSAQFTVASVLIILPNEQHIGPNRTGKLANKVFIPSARYLVLSFDPGKYPPLKTYNLSPFAHGDNNFMRWYVIKTYKQEFTS